MSLKIQARHHRVAVRPKVRRQRLQKAAAAAVILGLGFTAAMTWRHLKPQLPALKNLAPNFAPKPSGPALPKEVLARITTAGHAAGYLGPEGILVEAPEGTYPKDLPQVDVPRTDASRLKDAAKFLRQLSQSQALFSPLVSLKLISEQDGWKVAFADGTQAEWGDFRWTEMKLERLRQVLLESSGQFQKGQAGVEADLRYFENGRILVRPLSAREKI